MDVSINTSMVKFISSLIEEGKRYDGRDFFEYRKIKVIGDFVPNAEGSAYVEIGDTKALAGIKLEVLEPFPDIPDEGFFIVSLEYLSGSYYDKEPGPPSPEEIEYARIVDRIIRGAEFIKTKDMVIEEGKAVWAAFIDIYILNNNGNVVDAALLAAVRALTNTYFPSLIEKNGDYLVEHERTNKKLPVRKDRIPISVTFAKVGGKLLLDPILYEEEAANALVNIGISNAINSIQFMKESLIDLDELLEMIEIAKKERKRLLKYIK